LNSDWKGYSRGFGNQACGDVEIPISQNGAAHDPSIVQRDGFPAEGTISIGPYSVLIFSQDN
jgi:hypothetical protein